MNLRSKLQRTGWLVLCAAIMGLAAGCVPTVRYGTMPQTDLLASSLAQNVSTKGDVLKVLGPPRGYGTARLASLPNPDVIWFYEFLEAKANTGKPEARLKMLLVFFDKDRYAGYLWFSSFEHLAKAR